MAKQPAPAATESQNWDLIVKEARSLKGLHAMTTIYMGTQAKQFIAYAQKNEHLATLSPPLSPEQAQFLNQQFELLDQDLKQDPQWNEYWQAQAQGGEDPAFLRHIQHQILAAYRLTVIQSCTFDQLPILAIRTSEFLRLFNQYVLLYGPQDVYNHLKIYGEVELRQLCDNHLQQTKAYLESQGLPATIHWLELTLQDCRSSLAYQLLGQSFADLIIAPLEDKLKEYQTKMQQIVLVLENICKQALPGVIIQDFVTQEIEHLRKLHFFKSSNEITPVLLIKLLNTPAMIRMIHEKIILARVDSCLAYVNDMPQLRQQIRKITVYRVRRDVISELFKTMMNKYELFKNRNTIISHDDEECLMTLQEEYLHAIYRQIDKMHRQDIGAFLQKLQDDPVLKPLPKTSRFTDKIDFAQREFEYLLENYALPSNQYLQEGVPLHDIDCPIEMDLLGEMSHQLIEVASNEMDEMKDANIVMQELEATYKQIQAPDFTVAKTWEDYYHSQEYAKMQVHILEQSDLNIRLEQLESLNDKLMRDGELKVTWLKSIYQPQRKQMRMLKTWVQDNIYQSLIQLIVQSDCKTQWDKYALYQSRIAPYLRDLKQPTAHAIVQSLINKPLSSD